MSVRAYPTGPAGPRFTERASAVMLWLLLAILVFLGLDLAVRSHGIVPDYDALSYAGDAFRLHLGLTGTYLEPGRVYWLGLPFTNTLDTLVLALLYDLVDLHLAVWLVHTAYLVLFALLLQRLVGSATALVATAWIVANIYFLHQYTSFISEMKVGLFLTLFVACLFHPEVRAHRAPLFWITLLLLLLRTINVLFVAPLCVAFVVLRWLERDRRREIVPALAPVGLALLVLSPLFAVQVPKLLEYLHKTGTRTQQNWIDMTGVHNKYELAMAYIANLREYNPAFEKVLLAALALSVVLLATRRRRRLLGLRDAAIGTAIVAAVLMQAATTNNQVVFWLFALEGLLVALWLRAVAPLPVVGVAGALLFATALRQDYRMFVAAYREADPNLPVYRLHREMVHAMEDLPRPQIYSNFGGVGPIDARGLEMSLGRIVGWPQGDQVSYLKELAPYLESLKSAEIAFMANRNFIWPDYIGVNRHTEELSRWLAEHGTEGGWVRTNRLFFDGDPERYIDVYRRPVVKVNLKWKQYGDTWMDLQTPVVITIPNGGSLLAGSRLVVRVSVPQTSDPSFKPPIKAALQDASGKEIATDDAKAFGDNVLTFPVGDIPAGGYLLVFDRSFASPDPRKLVATFIGAAITPPDKK